VDGLLNFLLGVNERLEKQAVPAPEPAGPDLLEMWDPEDFSPEMLLELSREQGTGHAGGVPGGCGERAFCRPSWPLWRDALKAATLALPVLLAGLSPLTEEKRKKPGNNGPERRMGE
jgi:hypothetical protein